jgi:hypothetical protein
LYLNTTGAYNVAVGQESLYSNTTASNNTAVGYQAGYSNTTGSYNTTLGYQAGYSNTAALGSNLFVGYQAGYSTTGDGNTFVGARYIGAGTGSGSAVTTGSKNTILGAYSGNQGGLDIRTASNYIVLSDGDGNPRAYWNGANATFNGNLLIGSTTNTTNSNLILTGATRWAVGTQSGGNLFYIVRDSDGVGQYMVQGSTSWTATSDERLKDIIEPITNAASKVSTLRAVIGKFKKDEEGTRRSFLIAQDVQAVLPEAVTVQEDEFGTLGVQYTEVIPLLVAAIKELKAEVDSLKSQLKGA